MRLGTIQRHIWRAFVARPDVTLSTLELTHLAYPRLPASALKRWHRYSVRRAAAAVAVSVGRIRPGGLIWIAKPKEDLEP